MLLGGVCALVLLVYGFAARSGPLSALESTAAESYYNLLVRGFQAGHLSLVREAPAPLAQLPDPYDPAANVRLREAFPPLHDLSYFEGKLYLYFGVGPALVLFWPAAILTGHYLSHRAAAAMLVAVAFLAGVVLLRSIQRRCFPDARPFVLAAGGLALGLAGGWPLLLARADVYEVAIAGGSAGVFLCLAALWQALLRPRTAARWLAGASLAYGFAVASRPSLLPGAAILLLPVFWGEGERRGARWKNLVGAIGPLVVVGLGLLLYNDERFGRPWEFGQRYQLAATRQDTGELFSWRYLWFNFRGYFLEPFRWGRSFPFVGRSAAAALPRGHARVEDPFGVLLGVPLVWLALAAPLAWRRRVAAERTVLRGFAGGLAWLVGSAVLVLCLFNWSAARYEMDFLPALILLAALGLLGLDRVWVSQPDRRFGVGVLAGFLVAWSAAFVGLSAVARYAGSRSDLGALLVDAGRPAAAVPVLEGILQWQPERAATRVELGNALIRLGRRPEALRQYEEVLRVAPDDFEAQANRANVLLQLGRFEEGAAQYREILRRRPDFAGADRGLGFALAQLGRRDEAIAAYRAGLQLDPADAAARANLGSALAEAGRLPEAVEEFRTALRQNPADAVAHANLGLALAQQGAMDQAAAEFKEALRLEPESAQYHNYLGSAWANAGRLPEAIAEYEAALRLNPAEPAARENLAAARAQLQGGH